MAKTTRSAQVETPLVAPSLDAPVEVRLNEQQSERFDRMSRARTQVEHLAGIAAAQMGAGEDFSVDGRLSPEKKDKYADVWKITVGGKELAIKFRHDNGGGSFDAASNELAVDNESLRRRFPDMVGYAGCIRHYDESIIGVLMIYDPAPSLYEALGAGTVKDPDARAKLLDILERFAQAGYYLVDENPENIRVRADGTLFLIDGAAVSKHNRFGRMGDNVHPLPLHGGVPEDSPYAGMLEALDDASFDAELEGGMYEDEERPPMPEVEFLSSVEVVELVFDKMARERRKEA